MNAARPTRGLLFPIVLIGLGVVFLLGNLGYLPGVSVRALLQLWPLLLVLVGIDMLLARRSPYLALGLELAVVALGIALLASPGLGSDRGSVTTDATVGREGATSLSLRVSGGAGTYTVAGGAAALVEVSAVTIR